MDKKIDLQRRNQQAGFTLVETSVIVLVLVVLGGILLPQMGNYNRLARFTKAREELTALCSAAKTMLDQVWLGAFWDDPAGDTWDFGPTDPVGLLWGPGAAPVNGSVPNGDPAHKITGNGWFETSVMTFPCVTVTPDAGGAGVEFSCDAAHFHLETNDPHLGFPYPNLFDDPRPPGYVGHDVVHTFFGWRGPYVDALRPDPWGNRYMINTFALYGTEGIFSAPVFCYSTGPDLGVDTAFNQPAPGAAVVGGDDIAIILSAGGPF